MFDSKQKNCSSVLAYLTLCSAHNTSRPLSNSVSPKTPRNTLGSMRLNGPVTSKDRQMEGDLVARFLGWTARIPAQVRIAAEGILEAEIITILGAHHRLVTRIGLGHPLRTDHVKGTFPSFFCLSKLDLSKREASLKPHIRHVRATTTFERPTNYLHLKVKIAIRSKTRCTWRVGLTPND